MGCGVTAHTYQDALSLLQEKVFGNEPIPEIKSCVENIDVSTLDTGHILLNMRPPNLRAFGILLDMNRCVMFAEI